MKTVDFKYYISLVLIAFAMGLVSCSDSDNERTINVEDGSRSIIELGDTLVKGNVDFTEAELKKALQDSLWEAPERFYLPYVYDGDKMEMVNLKGLIGGPEPTYYQFTKNGEMNLYYPTSTKVRCSVKYIVKGKNITVIYTKSNGAEGKFELNVVSVDKTRIIFDMKYEPLYGGFEGDRIWFNPETAKYRFVWETGVRTTPNDVLPGGSVIM